MQSPSARSRKLSQIGVFSVALALTAAFYAIVSTPALCDSLAYRYFCGHPIEEWTTGLFFWGACALAWKAWRLIREQQVMGHLEPLNSPGPQLSVSEVPGLIRALEELPRRLKSTWLARRMHDALGYVEHSGSPEGLEERLETLANRDANELDESYELVRTVTWAIPILGFLGTVVGITIAIANITPEQLQDSLSEVVGGLAVAFDTTALALALSMLLVMGKFLVERLERGALGRVDAAVEQALLNRFEKQAPETRAFLGAVRGVADAVMQATRDAWREQGQLWARTVEQAGESLVGALDRAARAILEQTASAAQQTLADYTYRFSDIVKRLETLQGATELTASGLYQTGQAWIASYREEATQQVVRQETQFARFLEALEELHQTCRRALEDVAAKMTAHQAAVKRQAELMSQLVADEGRLSKLQQTLSNNLATLENVESLDEAVHSLTAAVHMLTARWGRLSGAAHMSIAPDSPAKEAA